LGQNPDAYKVREDIARLSRRIKSGEKDVAERRRRMDEQQGRVASLQEQLEALQDAQVGPRCPVSCIFLGQHTCIVL
jgi:polyhydroxyalkanoate synthesis regulator phasin